ncbi:MAG TPA: response regulator [Candidatus Limnocylindria bacterium]|jgi:two-component system alkaline phosphatase synthesis response regulator PhoP|nr:response regulator [Candidatus Limnocylindria bacterium]
MGARIWVVDDEPLIRAAIVAVLSEVGHEARGFEGAAELYESLVAGERPDLVILDHMLPDESGSTVVRSLRERAEYQDIPILFATAVTEDEAERLTDLAPVLTKPFDFRDLVETVEQQLAEAQPAEDDQPPIDGDQPPDEGAAKA